MVESTKASSGVGSKGWLEPLLYVAITLWTPTTISRDISGAKWKVTLFGVYLETSVPPKFRLPKKPLEPAKR